MAMIINKLFKHTNTYMYIYIQSHRLCFLKIARSMSNLQTSMIPEYVKIWLCNVSKSTMSFSETEQINYIKSLFELISKEYV